MPTIAPLRYGPNIDLNWDINPGVCSDMAYLMPMKDGSLAGVRVDSGLSGFSVTGEDHLHAEVFMQTSGSARFLTFRKQNIDEYTSGGTRTNRGTGYNASTTDWSAAAWGNQIIACNYLDATQSSTGAGFSGLGGGSPKARYVATNVNFVMLADVDDGGSNVYSDMVWWSALRNPSSWTPSLATQAGNVRLLDSPGPIKNIVAYGDKFIAFKENSVFLGQYVGPPYVFSWKIINDTIGLSYSKGITICDGVLYFSHISGLYAFDGQQFRNVGQPIWFPYDFALNDVRLRGDDIQGNVWTVGFNTTVSTFTQNLQIAYCYNARTGIWTRVGQVCSSSAAANNPACPVVYGTTAEYRAFTPLWGAYSGFCWIDNAQTTPKLSNCWGGNTTADQAATFTTGYWGANDQSSRTTRIYLRLPYQHTATTVTSATLYGYKVERGSADTTATLNFNNTNGTLDGVADGRYKTLVVTFPSSKVIRVAGVGFGSAGSGYL